MTAEVHDRRPEVTERAERVEWLGIPPLDHVEALPVDGALELFTDRPRLTAQRKPTAVAWIGGQKQDAMPDVRSE
jgi:hypothetical protein